MPSTEYRTNAEHVPGRKIKILIAEDLEAQREMLERNIRVFFADKPIAVFTTDRLEEAMALQRHRGPMDVSLIDLQLKDSAAENTLVHIPQLGDCVIVMSGEVSGATFRECKRHGAKDYIDKPIVMELLIDKMSRILDNIVPEENYVDIQRAAQKQLQQKATLAPVLGPEAVVVTGGRWFRLLAPTIAVLLPLITAGGGFIAGGWQKAQALGEERQLSKDKLERIETDVSEIKRGNQERDRKQELVRIDITALLTKDGLHPAPNN